MKYNGELIGQSFLTIYHLGYEIWKRLKADCYQLEMVRLTE